MLKNILIVLALVSLVVAAVLNFSMSSGFQIGTVDESQTIKFERPKYPTTKIVRPYRLDQQPKKDKSNQGAEFSFRDLFK